MWIKAKFALCKSRQTIMAFVEIYRLGGDHDPDGLRWVDHLRCIKRCAMSAIRLGVVFSGTRTETAPTVNSIPSNGSDNASAITDKSENAGLS
jgi:hypothetical protein|tara:strand:+ start:119 stop:397 length:279 start_codon:yes stop_codon:yes gene_type:complete